MQGHTAHCGGPRLGQPCPSQTRTMTRPFDTHPTLEWLETAIEVSCAALVALESICRRGSEAPSEMRGPQRHFIEITAALGEAVAELRALRGDQASMLAFGFVLEADSASSPGDQLKPRRTA